MHAFKYQFKIIIRDKIMIFWTLLFPLILATFFNLAFSNLTSSEEFKNIDIAVVQQKEDVNFKPVLEALSTGKDKLLNIKYVDKTKADQLLENEEIDGYLLINDKINVVISENGIHQTILKTVVDEYYQTTSTMTNIASLNPAAFASGIMSELDSSRDNFKDVSTSNTDLTVIYFYTLIGMTCLYGGFLGITVTSKTEANLSRQGTRVTMAPIAKFKVLLSGLSAAFIIQYGSMLILMAYLIYGLSINFGSQVGYILLLMAMGCFVGISLGTLIGTALKCKEDTKISICVSITMLMSFLSGMMVVDIKYWILENIPIAANLNPVSLITDALYSLYYYTTTDRYFFNLACLFAIGLVFAILSFLFMRRKKYDSI